MLKQTFSFWQMSSEFVTLRVTVKKRRSTVQSFCHCLLHSFFFENGKIWDGQTTLNGEKKGWPALAYLTHAIESQLNVYNIKYNLHTLLAAALCFVCNFHTLILKRLAHTNSFFVSCSFRRNVVLYLSVSLISTVHCYIYLKKNYKNVSSLFKRGEYF